MSVDGNMPTQGVTGGPVSAQDRFAVREQRLTLIDVWRILFKHRYLILSTTLLMLVVSIWYAFKTPRIYESIGRIEIQPQQSADVGVKQLIEESKSGEGDEVLQTEVKVLQSDTVLLKTALRLHLVGKIENGNTVPSDSIDDLTPVQQRAATNLIRGGLKVSVVSGTNIVEIRYRNHDPKLAAAIANTMVDVFIDEDLHSRFSRTIRISEWLERQMEQLKVEAVDAQDKLAEYQRDHNIVGGGDTVNLPRETLGQLAESLNTAEADRIMKESRMHDYMGQSDDVASLTGDNPNASTLRAQIGNLEAQRAELSTRYGPNYPKMLDLQRQIDSLNAQLKQEVKLSRQQIQSEYKSAADLESNLRKRLEQQEDTVFKQDKGGAQYAILQNQAELTRDLYDTLQVRLKEAAITSGLSAANITIVDKANVPVLAVLPRRKLAVMLGVAAGVLLGALLAFLLESVDDRVQTSEDAESFSGLTTLATIPAFGRGKKRDSKEERLNESRFAEQLVVLRDGKSNIAESYRNFRSALLLSSVDHPPKVVVISSAFPAEGKSTTALNTAVVLAQRGEKVLLVDGDLRRGLLGEVFGGLKTSAGLSHILANPDQPWEIATPIEDMPNLHVVPTGPRPPNPAEMLSSTRMVEQIKLWRQTYDRIVIDSAPLLLVSDTRSLAVLSDAVVIVARAGVTRGRALIRARDILMRVQAPLTGVVVNGVDVHMENFYTNSSYGLYGYRNYRYNYHVYDDRYTDRAYGADQDEKGE